jgi:ABC-2 type transport system permease protein
MAAFLRRDAQIALSYRLPFVFDIVAAAFTLVAYRLVSNLVPVERIPGGYFSFVVVGLALATFMGVAVTGLGGNLRQEQVQGTLEDILSVGLRARVLAAGMAAYPLVSATVRAVVYVLLAALLGAQAPHANWGLAIAAAILGAFSFVGIGLVGAALVLVLRQGAAATAWLIAVLALAGGVLFPPELLPEWVRSLSILSPFTVALRVIRGAVLDQTTWSEGWEGLALLAALAVGYVAVGMGALSLALSRVRRTGGSSNY